MAPRKTRRRAPLAWLPAPIDDQLARDGGAIQVYLSGDDVSTLIDTARVSRFPAGLAHNVVSIDRVPAPRQAASVRQPEGAPAKQDIIAAAASQIDDWAASCSIIEKYDASRGKRGIIAEKAFVELRGFCGVGACKWIGDCSHELATLETHLRLVGPGAPARGADQRAVRAADPFAIALVGQ